MTTSAFAADSFYTIEDDTQLLSPAVFYSEDYTPGMLRSATVNGSPSTFVVSSYAYGSFSAVNYNPRHMLSSKYTDFNTLTPSVYLYNNYIAAEYELLVNPGNSGSLLILPSFDSTYFDFQSSDISFDQESAGADTFTLNGTLEFYLSNQWFVNGEEEFYFATNPVAVQVLVDGRPYGDPVRVSSYTSSFTDATTGEPSLAVVNFDNVKFYYQNVTPELIGFRVYVDSPYGSKSISYSNTDVMFSNAISFSWQQLPTVAFTKENADSDYSGDLSGISGLLSSVNTSLSNVFSLMVDLNGDSWLKQINSYLNNLVSYSSIGTDWYYLSSNGTLVQTTQLQSISHLLRNGLLGLRTLLVNFETSINSSVSSFESTFRSFNLWPNGTTYLSSNGGLAVETSSVSLANVLRSGILGIRQIMIDGHKYFSNTVFPWQSYNMDTHQLNAATNVNGQNNLFLTAFQSIEDKLGRLAYVFGSDEDLDLKDAADPGTDAFRENFGGGLSLGQIGDGADVVKGVNGLFDSGFSFGDAFTEISGESMFTMWFSAENAAALDSTGSVMALDDSDPYNMQIYYDSLERVAGKRNWGLTDG